MIDFACKEIHLEEIIKCSYMLTKADLKVFKRLMKINDWENTEEISKALKLNLSTVQRTMKKLHGQNLVERRQTNLEGGGYSFIYKIKDKEQIIAMTMSIVNSWVKKVEKELRGM